VNQVNIQLRRVLSGYEIARGPTLPIVTCFEAGRRRARGVVRGDREIAVGSAREQIAEDAGAQRRANTASRSSDVDRRDGLPLMSGESVP